MKGRMRKYSGNMVTVKLEISWEVGQNEKSKTEISRKYTRRHRYCKENQNPWS
jgi:hypothetical protein